MRPRLKVPFVFFNAAILAFPSGEVKLNYRNILTFGAGGGFGEPFPE